MSASVNVAKQVCAIDHFTGKYSFLLINQFIQINDINPKDLRKYPSSAVAVQSEIVHARISLAQYIKIYHKYSFYYYQTKFPLLQVTETFL